MKNVKAGRPLIDLVKLCYRANQPLLLVGKHGVGKSQVLEAAAKELGVEYICRDLALMEPPDLVGLPEKNGNTTRYLPPNFLPTKGKGILVFEELNRCPSYMRAPCLQLLTARELNDYKLPTGWLPVAAINPPDEGYEVQELDPALMSRFVKATVVADRKEWLEWADRNSMDKTIVSYVNHDAKIFSDTSPRDWSMASELIKASDKVKVSQAILDTCLAGVIGRERLSAYKAFLKGGVPLPSINEILDDYVKHTKLVKDLVKSNQIDALENLCYSLKVYLQNSDNYECLVTRADAWRGLSAFLQDIIPDLREDVLTFFKKHQYTPPYPYNEKS